MRKKLFKCRTEVEVVVEAYDDYDAHHAILDAMCQQINRIEAFNSIDEITSASDLPFEYDEDSCPDNGHTEIREYLKPEPIADMEESLA